MITSISNITRRCLQASASRAAGPSSHRSRACLSSLDVPSQRHILRPSSSRTHTRPYASSIHTPATTCTEAEPEESIAKSMASMVASERGDRFVPGEEGMRMLIFGKPGSGKGTLSSRLVKMYDIAFVSTGDVLRKEIAAKSEVGLKAEEIVRTGGLVSDELMVEIVKAELDRLRGRSWIIDGFPRTLHQGKLLDDVLHSEGRPLNMIVHLNVPDSVIMARIAARWVHLPSGRVYNTTYSAPRVEGIDDITGEPLTKRADDTPEVFSKRLKAYYDSTAPLLEFFSSNYPDSLRTLSGSTSDEVLSASGFYSVPPPPKVYASDQDALLFSSHSALAAHSLSHAEYASRPLSSDNSDAPPHSPAPKPMASTRKGRNVDAAVSSSTPSSTTSTSSSSSSIPPAFTTSSSTYSSIDPANNPPQSDVAQTSNPRSLVDNDHTLLSSIHKSGPGPLSYDPLIHFSPAVNATLDQLWPQLQALVEPFGLRRRDHALDKRSADEVRSRADDLRDPEADTKSATAA